MDIAKKLQVTKLGSLWSHPKNEVVFFLFPARRTGFYDRAYRRRDFALEARMSIME